MSDEAVAAIIDWDGKGGADAALGCVVGLLTAVGAAFGLRYGLGWSWPWAGLAGAVALIFYKMLATAIVEPLFRRAALRRVAAKHGATPASLYESVFNLVAGESPAYVRAVLKGLDPAAYKRDKKLLAVLDGRWNDVERKDRETPRHRKRLSDALLEAAGHQDPKARVAAAHALGRLGSPACERLIKGDREDFARLAGSGEAGVAAALRAGLRNDKIGACLDAAKALGVRGGEESIGLLRQALTHRHWEVAMAAGESLSRLGVDPTRFRPKGTAQRNCPKCGKPSTYRIKRVTAGDVLRAAIVGATFVGIAAVTYSFTRGFLFKVAAVVAVLSVLGFVVTLCRALRLSFLLTSSCGECGLEETGDAIPFGTRWEAVKHLAAEHGGVILKNTYVMCHGGLYRCKKNVSVEKGKEPRGPAKDKEHWAFTCALDYDTLPDELKTVWYYG